MLDEAFDLSTDLGEEVQSGSAGHKDLHAQAGKTKRVYTVDVSMTLALSAEVFGLEYNRKKYDGLLLEQWRI